MDAVNKRREYLLTNKARSEELMREDELKRLKEETMRCNIISQRITLQEYCIEKADDIKSTIENMLKDEEGIKALSREDVENLFDTWFQDFEIPQPSEFFFHNPTDDSDLYTNIQRKNDFVLSCLEIFDLPVRYMEGNGHFPDWGKEKNEKAGATLLRGMQKKKQNKTKKLNKKFKDVIKKNEKEEKVKPTHFDLEPFLKAFKEFVSLDSNVRSRIRMEMKKEIDVIESIFIDLYNEKSYKKCVDIMSIEKLLANRQINLHSQPNGTVGKILRCFGELSYQLKEVIKMPEKDPKEVARELQRKKEEEEAKLKEEGDKGKEKRGRMPTMDEDSDELKKKAPPQPIRVKLYETSIYDFHQALNKSQDYDFTLNELGVVKTDLEEEKVKEGMRIKTEEDSDVDVSGDETKNFMAKPNLKRPSTEEVKYSDDSEYNELVKHLKDLESIPSPPEKAKNAFAITLFCIELAFDSRSRDFLRYAFDLYPDRDYLILTQPHTVPESTLLQKFSLVSKKSSNTFQHVLYIIHRDSLLDTETQIRRAIADDIEDIQAL